MLSKILLPTLLAITATALPSQISARDDLRYATVEYFRAANCAGGTGIGAKSYVPGGTNPGCFNRPPSAEFTGTNISGQGCKTFLFPEPDCPDGQGFLASQSGCYNPDEMEGGTIMSVIVSCDGK